MLPGFIRNYIALWTSGFLLFALSISTSVVALVGNGIWNRGHFERTGTGLTNICKTCELDLEPDHLARSTLPLITAAGFLTVFALLLGTYSVLSKFIAVGVFGALIGTALPLAALVYSMKVYYKSDRNWEYYDPDSSDRAFTLESWTCSITDANALILHPEHKRDFSKVCNLSMAARWLTVPLLVLAILFFTLVIFITLRKRNGDKGERYAMEEQKKMHESSPAP